MWIVISKLCFLTFLIESVMYAALLIICKWFALNGRLLILYSLRMTPKGVETFEINWRTSTWELFVSSISPLLQQRITLIEWLYIYTLIYILYIYYFIHILVNLVYLINQAPWEMESIPRDRHWTFCSAGIGSWEYWIFRDKI